MICVDSSVAAKWLFDEEHSARAESLLRDTLESRQPIVAPPLLASEVANIIRQRMRQGQLDLGQARNHLKQFLAVPMSIRAPTTLYEQALIIADRYGLPAVYDAHYVALAEMLDTILWTADQRLLRALDQRVPLVRFIGDYAE